jgi:hypothetical protein
LDNIEEMKVSVLHNHNRAEEVTARTKEDLALTRLIRWGADRDLVQA